jgi:hypothetical protein
MSNTIEKEIIFPELTLLKRELLQARDFLPAIQGRNGELRYSPAASLYVGATPEETIDKIRLLPFSAKGTVFNRFAQYFIQSAFDFGGEQPPNRIHAYCGVVGESGQYLDYLHCDAMQYRITSNVVDASCAINPSTQKAPLNSEEAAAFENYSEHDIPFSIFEPQAPEGGIVGFFGGQFHLEKNLPLWVAKLFMAATFDNLY